MYIACTSSHFVHRCGVGVGGRASSGRMQRIAALLEVGESLVGAAMESGSLCMDFLLDFLPGR